MYSTLTLLQLHNDSQVHELKQLLSVEDKPVCTSVTTRLDAMSMMKQYAQYTQCDNCTMQVAFDSQVHELKRLLSTEEKLSELRNSISGLAGDVTLPPNNAASAAGLKPLPAWTPEQASLGI